MNYSELQVLATAPPYGTMTAAEAADAINALTETRAREYHATTRSLMADLGPTTADAILTALETAAASNSVIARTLKLLSPVEGGIDLAHPVVQAQLDGLQAAGVLTAEWVTALRALAVETVPTRVAMGFSEPLSAQQIAYARAGSW